MNFTHNKSVAEAAETLGVPVSWMVRLGCLLAAGSLGLVAGFAVPALGTAAACGLVLYFLSAAGAHIRAPWFAAVAAVSRRLSSASSAGSWLACGDWLACPGLHDLGHVVIAEPQVLAHECAGD